MSARGLLLATLLVLLHGHAETTEAAETVTHRSRHWMVEVPAELAARRSAASWGTAADQRLEEIARRLGVPVPAEPLRLYVDDSTFRLEGRVGGDAPFTVLPERREVAHLVAPEGTITDAGGDARLLLQLAWGAPGSEALAAAVARAGSGSFFGRPLATYAAAIHRAEGLYTLHQILRLGADPREGELSPLVGDALGGAWAEQLKETRGVSVLRRLWSSPGEEKAVAVTLGTSWEQLEKDWRRWLESRPAPPREEPIPPLGGFLRGISFSHEVRRAGYGSDAAASQLARIREIGANAVSIVPYGFTRAPEEPTVRYLGTDESDDRVLRTLAQARRLGLKTILKPQLWAPRRFTGDIVFDKPADFARWWAGYRRWMLHHARVAALGRADLLVIGTELGGVTRHHEAWRALIRDVRRIYPGPLTYAANWWGDFETMPFWGDLDLLGLNMYYPLAAKGETPEAGSPRLRELRTKLAALSRREGKPILFTEIGYAASTAAAAEPWNEEHGPLDPAMQARCYEVVFEAFGREPWLAGFFWWKWPSHGQGAPGDPSFSPLEKPALAVLKQWYGGRLAR